MADKSIPFLKKTGPTWELFVDGKPFLLRSAELHNSSMSSSSYMNGAWHNLVEMGINTVLGAVSWKDIEPVEGRFEFSELDAVLQGARSHGLRLIILWFGSFKNGASSYTPDWVSKDPARFPRMLRRVAGKVEVVNAMSIFAGEGASSDSKAFEALMGHLRDVDDRHRTVLMVQVENEVGLLEDSCDRSTVARELFDNSATPAELLAFLHDEWESLHPQLKDNFQTLPAALQSWKASSGTSTDKCSWSAIFGNSSRAEELFMAYHYALYVEKVASAGCKAYALPLFANAWIPMPPAEDDAVGSGVASGGGQPGEYPSGGPTPSVLDIWLKFAPSLDFLSPDIYTGHQGDIMASYSHKGRPLFIPEQRRDEYGARRLWQAIGTYGALGVSPFGIDSLSAAESAFTKHYKLLASVSGIVSEARLRPESMFGFFFDEAQADHADAPIVKRFSAFELTITRAFVFGKPGPGFGLIIEMKPDRFLFIGAGYKVQFASTSPTSVFTSVLSAEEKRVVDPELGVLETQRRLNGDETHGNRWVNMANEDPDYGEAFIPVLFPARTMITEATVHSLDRSQVSDMALKP